MNEAGSKGLAIGPRALGQWRALTGAGIAAQYWAQENGWEKKAESAGAG